MLFTKVNGVTHFSLDETEVVPEEDVKRMLSLGYEIVSIPGFGDEKIFRRSLLTDGYIRDMTVQLHWNENIVLFNKEDDQMKWKTNVILWFKGAKDNEQYINSLQLMYPDIDPVVILDTASEYMVKQRPRKKGGSGKRRGDLHNWLFNDKIPFTEKVVRRLTKEVISTEKIGRH
jgi:hypothetical protein